jgi:integrase
MQDHRNDRAVSGHVKLVQRQRGPVFYLKYRLPNGRQVQRKLGDAWNRSGRPPAGFYTRKMAEVALQGILTDARRGQFQPDSVRGVTFANAAEEWIAFIEFDRKRKRGTVAGYRSMLNRHILPAFGSRPVGAITAAEIDRYRRDLVAAGALSDRSINKLLTQLHAIFRHAQRVHGLPQNPVAAAERQPQRRSGDIEVLTIAQVEALGRVAASPEDAALYRVAAYTGLRQGELRALTWRDVDFAGSFIYVRRSYTSGELGLPKSGRVRSVPLIDEAATALASLSNRLHFTGDDDLVFPGGSGSFQDESALRRRFKAALRRAGIGDFRFHDLRHTFGTIAVQAFPISDVQGYMGHADLSTTLVYVHHQPQRDAAARLNRVVAESRDLVSPGVSPSRVISDSLGELQLA